MEEDGEEQINARQSIRQLEDAAQLLSDASKSLDPEKISFGFADRLSDILAGVTVIDSSEDAERLLALGMWLLSRGSSYYHPYQAALCPFLPDY